MKQIICRSCFLLGHLQNNLSNLLAATFGRLFFNFFTCLQSSIKYFFKTQPLLFKTELNPIPGKALEHFHNSYLLPHVRNTIITLIYVFVHVTYVIIYNIATRFIILVPCAVFFLIVPSPLFGKQVVLSVQH